MAPKNSKGVQQESYDSFDVKKLKEVVPTLRQKLEESALSRSNAQSESRILPDRYDIIRKETADVDMRVSNMESQMRLLKEKYDAGCCAFERNMECLQCGHEDVMCKAVNSYQLAQKDVQNHQEPKLNQLKLDTNELRRRMKEIEEAHIADITSEQTASVEILAKIREDLETSLSNQRDHCNEKLRKLQADLDVRHNCDMNITNEWWNQHISDLISSHNLDFQQLKNKRKENQTLLEPLQEARVKVIKLQEQLKDRAKDNLSLSHAKGKFKADEQKILILKENYAKLLEDFEQVEKERNDIYEAFQNALSRVRDQTDSQHLLLEHKIENAEESIISTTLQLEEIAVVSGMSNQEIKSITESYDNKLDPLNTRILNLQHKLTEIRKAYSNSMGTYLRELRKEGVPEDKIGEVFAHKIPEAETSTHMGLFAAA